MLVRVVDTMSGVRLRESEIRIPARESAPKLTLRQILAERVAMEVAAFNRSRSDVYQGLVQPEETERVLNGYRLKEFRPLDADQELHRALRAFESNGFLVFSGGRQIESLDEHLDLPAAAELEFVKLFPLMGG
jgi:hypothetical protein